ncbi:MAG: hypothetical protein HUJ76_13275, partial [Parasporobacterium sp.]|nr:hypothetical protein [Parasporobacterium sp.]
GDIWVKWNFQFQFFKESPYFAGIYIDSVDHFVEGYRDADVNVLSRYAVSITVTDSEGELIQPDTEFGNVKVYFGIPASRSELAAELTDKTKSDIIDIALEKLGGEIELSDDERAAFAEQIDFAFNASDLSVDVYHIADNGSVTKMSVNLNAYAEGLDSSEVISVNTDSFSTWEVEISAEKLSDEEMEELADALINDPVTAEEGEEVEHEHTPRIDEVGFPATCLTDGVTDVIKCDECGMVLERAETIPKSPLYHNFVIDQVIPPTCTEWGESIYKCSVCGDTEPRDYVKPTGHTFVFDHKVYPTCLTAGYDVYKCSTAGCMGTENRNEVSATGHNFGFDHTVDPTCYESGYDVYKCSNAGCMETENRNEVS